MKYNTLKLEKYVKVKSSQNCAQDKKEGSNTGNTEVELAAHVALLKMQSVCKTFPSIFFIISYCNINREMKMRFW